MPIETQVKEVVSALETVQKTIDEFGEKLTVLEKDKIEKATEDFSIKMEEMQAEQLKKDAEAKERIENLELAMAKKENGSKLDTKQYEHEFKLYLRKKQIPSPEAVEKSIDAFLEGKTGLDDNDKALMRKDLVNAIGSDGGYFVLPERSASMITRQFETSPMRSLANIVSITSDSFEIVLDDNEGDCGWVGETDARPTTNTPQIGLLTIPVHEVYAYPRATQKMLDNAGFDIESWLNNKSIDVMSRTANTAFVAGDGIKKPKGFLSYSAWDTAGTYQRDALEVRDSGHNGGFGSTAATRGNCLIDLQSDLHERYQANAKWGMTRKTLGEISKLKDGQGVFLFDRSAFIASGMKPMVLGKEVAILADMEEVATDALAVVYGDFREGYTIVDRIGVRILRNPYSPPYVSFYVTMGVGGAVTNFEAIKILKLAA